jgi:hypothetical protein
MPTRRQKCRNKAVKLLKAKVRHFAAGIAPAAAMAIPQKGKFRQAAKPRSLHTSQRGPWLGRCQRAASVRTVTREGRGTECERLSD